MELAALAELPRDELTAHVATLSASELVALRWRLSWYLRARAKQLPPTAEKLAELKLTDWYIWYLMSGRGFGKTLTGANWLGLASWDDPGSRGLVVAPTHDDCRSVCFEGETGLLAVVPPELVENYNKTNLELTLSNGSFIKGYNAIEPERLRGPQWHRAWLEEVGSWRHDRRTWDNVVFSVRLGDRPKICVTSTPRPRPLVKLLTRHENCVLVRGTTYENKDNLAKPFLDEILKYEGTKIGRQEIHGELLDPEESGIVRRSQFKLWPAERQLPSFAFVVLSLDTAFTEETLDEETGDPDFTAGSVWGVFHDRRQLVSFRGRTKQAVLPNVMLLDAWQDRLGFPELVSRVKRELKARYGAPSEPIVRPAVGAPLLGSDGRKPDLVIIEDKGSGISLRQTLELDGVQAYPYNPHRTDKLARLHVVSPLFARGRVWTPESRKHPGAARAWAEPLIEQFCSYAGAGTVDHDDLLDTGTQALRVLVDFGLLRAATDEELLKLAQGNFERQAQGLAEEALYSDPEARYDPPPVARINPYSR